MATSKNNTSDNIRTGKNSGCGAVFQGEIPDREQVQPEQQEQQTEQKQIKSDKVMIKLFYDGARYKDDVFVGVNGRRYQIKRGVEVEVPLAVKEVLDNSMRQDAAANRYMIELSNEAQKRFKEFDR